LKFLNSTVASVGVSGVLAAIGFVAEAPSQTIDVVNKIRLLGTGVPLLAVVLEIVGVGLIWNLREGKMNRN